jgi:tRNA(fMet)-specific endonuclease VapC
MLVLDTDHVSEYQKGNSPEALSLKARLQSTTEPIATTIITVEEIMRGWMADLRRMSSPRQQIRPYARLRLLFRFFATWNVLDWDEASARQFESIKAQKVRVGTMDLKVASICLANESTLLTRNVRDFERVPGLRIEDWLT